MTTWNHGGYPPPTPTRRSLWATTGNWIAITIAIAVLILAAPSVWDWASEDAIEILTDAGYSGGGLKLMQLAAFLITMAGLGLAAHLAVLLLGLAVGFRWAARAAGRY